MKQQSLDEKQLQELLELARVAEQNMKQSSEGLAALAEKWQHRTKAAIAAKKEH